MVLVTSYAMQMQIFFISLKNLCISNASQSSANLLQNYPFSVTLLSIQHTSHMKTDHCIPDGARSYEEYGDMDCIGPMTQEETPDKHAVLNCSDPSDSDG